MGTDPRPTTAEPVGRTIIVVVDDLGLSVEGIQNVQRALRRFVENGFLSMDRVAIIRTGESRGILQSLTNNRATLQAAVDALQYNTRSRKGVAPSGDVIQGLNGPEFDVVGELQRSVSTAGSLAALNVTVQAARDLPGRKTVIFASEGFQLVNGTDAKAMPDSDPRLRNSVDRVIDQAARSGVVIYAMDGQALQASGLRASDDIHFIDSSQNRDAMGEAVRGLAAERLRAYRDSQESLTYLAEQTGGVAVLNTNDLAGALNRIANDIRDYYVIGYLPDRSTFALQGRARRLHKIVVNVKRAGVRVTARKEFIGVSDPERASMPLTPAQQLVRAAFSPFTATTIPLRATNIFGYSQDRGPFVRTVLHVEANALAYSTGPTGVKSASADLVGLVFDGDGAQVDTVSTGFDVALENASAEQAIRNGLVFTARVPIGKPGAYQLRYAVRDRRSGAIGSVGGFVDIPDVAAGTFAASGVVLSSSEFTATRASIDSDRFSVSPTDALRVYAPGTSLSYTYEIYNAGSAVHTATTLWRGAEKLLSLPADALQSSSHVGAFAAFGRVKLPDDLSIGTYVLQIAATSDDPKHAKGTRAAVERLSFEVR